MIMPTAESELRDTMTFPALRVPLWPHLISSNHLFGLLDS